MKIPDELKNNVKKSLLKEKEAQEKLTQVKNKKKYRII